MMIFALPGGCLLLIGWCLLRTLSCRHHFIRARFESGEYGLRCEYCSKPHRNTWEKITREKITRG